MLRAEALTTVPAARSVAGGWDALAVARGRPACAPGVLLPWFEHVGAREGDLHVVAVRDGDEVVGVLPGWRRGPTLRLLGAGAVHRLGLLAAAGREEEVHRAVAAHLAADHALQALRLEGVCAQDDLARALGRGWPRGRPWWLHDERMAAPLVTLHPDGHEAWLASRSSSLRKTFGKQRRRLERSGGAVRVVRGTDEARAAVAELVRLHRAQWGPLGIDGPTAAALGAAVETLGERLRLQVLELDGAVRAVELQLVAGRVGQAVVGAFEPVAGLSPGLLTLEAALRDAHERGLAVLDLGGGDQPYKARLADGDAPLSWWTLLPPGVRGVRGAAREAPRLGRTLARRARGRLRRADGAAAQASR